MSTGIGILGGTFDPIHYGHLRAAADVRTALGLDEVRLLPAGNPYHRTTKPAQATAAQRLEMALLAVREFPGLTVDPRETLQTTPSYTAETLSAIRAESGTVPLLLLLGADTFATLPGWRRWQELFQFAHIVVVQRPGFDLEQPLPVALQAELAIRTTSERGLLSAPAGHIYIQQVVPQPISATGIRAILRSGRRPDGLLPAAVVAYIESHSLYQH